MAPALVSSMFQTIKAVLSDEAIAARLKETQQMTLILGGPAELDKFLARQMQVWNPVVRESGIKAQ